MRDVELYCHLLGLESPWTVRSVELNVQEQGSRRVGRARRGGPRAVSRVRRRAWRVRLVERPDAMREAPRGRRGTLGRLDLPGVGEGC